jgi:hypothetical protein
MPPFKQTPPTDEEIKQQTMEIVERNKALAKEREEKQREEERRLAGTQTQTGAQVPVEPTPQKENTFWWQKGDSKPELRRNEDGTFSEVESGDADGGGD